MTALPKEVPALKEVTLTANEIATFQDLFDDLFLGYLAKYRKDASCVDPVAEAGRARVREVRLMLEHFGLHPFYDSYKNLPRASIKDAVKYVEARVA